MHSAPGDGLGQPGAELTDTGDGTDGPGVVEADGPLGGLELDPFEDSFDYIQRRRKQKIKGNLVDCHPTK